MKNRPAVGDSVAVKFCLRVDCLATFNGPGQIDLVVPPDDYYSLHICPRLNGWSDS